MISNEAATRARTISAPSSATNPQAALRRPALLLPAAFPLAAPHRPQRQWPVLLLFPSFLPLTRVSWDTKIHTLKTDSGSSPEYRCPEATHLAKNTATFAHSKATQACLAVMSVVSLSSHTGNAYSTARGLRVSRRDGRGTEFAVLAAARVACRVMTVKERAGWSQWSPPPAPTLR